MTTCHKSKTVETLHAGLDSINRFAFTLANMPEDLNASDIRAIKLYAKSLQAVASTLKTLDFDVLCPVCGEFHPPL